MWRCILVAGLAIALLAGSGGPGAIAAPGGQKVIAPGKLVIAGRRLRCGKIPTVYSTTFAYYAAAGKGVILINPRKIARLPAVVRWIIYYHECGHHRVGLSEVAADCFAVRTGIAQGWLSRSGLRHVCRSFRGVSGGPHPPGPRRCKLMEQCYDAAIRHRASGKR